MVGFCGFVFPRDANFGEVWVFGKSFAEDRTWELVFGLFGLFGLFGSDPPCRNEDRIRGRCVNNAAEW
jgi:hypothetical protein